MQFFWRIDSDGRIVLCKSPPEAKLPNKELFLAAHRTFQIDIRGNTETYIIATWFKGHEAYWKFERVGDMKDQRFII
jgi:hypothetical protein